MVTTTNLGFPRIGAKRELKKAVEAYWKGDLSREELLATGKNIRLNNWKLQKSAGLDHIPSNDFSFYDTVLDMSATLGCVPERYGWTGGDIDLDLYFAMARGAQKDGRDVIACEMTKWFDTNYHYLVPEFSKHQVFTLSSTKIFDHYQEAKDNGVETRPVLIGPVTYLLLGKSDDESNPLDLLPRLLPVYEQILKRLDNMGVGWVQIDEPFLALDLNAAHAKAYKQAYSALNAARGDIKLLLTTYFEGLKDNTDLACELPVQGLHIDLARAPNQLDDVLAALSDDCVLSLGLVDGRSIWKNNLSRSVAQLETAIAKIGPDRVMVGPSCSLLHVPVDLDLEVKMDAEIKNWMAFATQKLSEITLLGKEASDLKHEIAQSDKIVAERQSSSRIHNKQVQERVSSLTSDMRERKSPYEARAKVQQEHLQLPMYPTTTIGSFPQTQEIRKSRAAFKKGTLSEEEYLEDMKAEIANCVSYQEHIDMDVLVHGEAERNDMVEYFGEQLEGYIFSKFGWVQSYGSRCVKPPIIFGDVSRSQPMTVFWSQYAQSLTDRPLKAMLTGPITMLMWSFKRDDVTWEESARQIALAIRDEVADLEQAGISVIQVDEAAIREGLPLREEDRENYLNWAVDCFKLSTCCVEDKTQIHTHMCYSEFNDIIKPIADLDADVISIETSRSQMELLDAFVAFKYPNEIGPGVYDIHSPRIPTEGEMVALLEKAAKVIPEERLWVNPDCGLKTRGWAEVKPALEHMIKAAKEMRAKTSKRKVA